MPAKAFDFSIFLGSWGATELIKGGVSLATLRKCMGHKNLQTTLRYAEQQSDATADADMRTGRRKQDRSR